jgi:hypothetical protein
MSWGQYAEAAVNIVGKRFGAEWPEYVPDYTKCADHFAIHAGEGVKHAHSLRLAAVLQWSTETHVAAYKGATSFMLAVCTAALLLHCSIAGITPA